MYDVQRYFERYQTQPVFVLLKYASVIVSPSSKETDGFRVVVLTNEGCKNLSVDCPFTSLNP